jgi:hypothetical protein
MKERRRESEEKERGSSGKTRGNREKTGKDNQELIQRRVKFVQPNRIERRFKKRREKRMPQLDTATFRGQVTWLARVFGVLYRARTGEILPKVSRIVKLRSKKRDRTRGDATQYDGERTRVESGYSTRLGNAAGSSYGLLQETMDVQNHWMNQEVVKRNQSKGMKTAMKQYRSYRMNVKLADVYLSKKLADGKVKKGAGKRGKAKVDTKKTGTKGGKKG